jgi:hypothetical protein
LRGQARHYRIGPADKSYDHPAYRHEVHAFQGFGLCPYAPVHLVARVIEGDVAFSWVRRARVDADSWDLSDIPLGEAREAYQVRVVQGDQVMRVSEVTTPAWIYTAAMRAADGVVGEVSFEVAQISDRFGPGRHAGVSVSL